MELNHLRYFYEVARLKSFTGAARHLRVSQPSVSKIVRQLEERQNVKLLDRTKRGGVALTPVGQRFFVSCQQIFGEVESLKQAVASGRDACAGDLALGASDNLCNYVLPEAYREFHKRHPLVTLKLFSGTSEDIKRELGQGRIELGLFYMRPRESYFEVEELGFVEFVIVAAPARVKSGKATALTLAELASMTYVGSRAADYAKIYPASQMLEDLGIKPASIMECNNQETQKRLALAGYGYSVLPLHTVKEELRQGKARALRTTGRPVGTSVYLVQRKGKTLSVPGELFGSHIRGFWRAGK